MSFLNLKRKIVKVRDRKVDVPLSLSERLEKAIKEFFPKDGSWSSSEYTYFRDSLIGNLRNNFWLAKKISEKYNISLDDAITFVENSIPFQEERDNYEQRIIKWQIEWMINGGAGWLVPKGYGDDFVVFNEDIDIAFRLGIVNTLISIGMNREAIEKGIESNASLWRRQIMEKAFKNRYEPSLRFMLYADSISACPREYIDAWVKLRLYEYYRRHKNSVDRYGSGVPEMNISLEEVQKLQAFLSAFHKERMAYLDDFEKNGKKSTFSLARNLTNINNN